MCRLSVSLMDKEELTAAGAVWTILTTTYLGSPDRWPLLQGSVSQGPGRHVGQPENSSDGRPDGALVPGASSRVDVPSSLSWPRVGDTAWALEEAPDRVGGGDISRGSQRKCAHRV